MKKLRLLYKQNSFLQEFICNELKKYFEIKTSLLFNSEEDLQLDEITLIVVEGFTFEEVMHASKMVRNHAGMTFFIGSYRRKIFLGTKFIKDSSCIDSVYFSLENYRLGNIPSLEDLNKIDIPIIDKSFPVNNLYQLISTLTYELNDIIRFGKKRKGNFTNSILLFDANKEEAKTKYIYPFLEEMKGAVAERNLDTDYENLLHSVSQIKSKNFFVAHKSSKKQKSIGIIGGGSAGYMTALALKKSYPDYNITLIESSKIPIIGVGEATTPIIHDFLFKTLGFNKLDFYSKVKPTWKLGIKFLWGQNSYFNYPFGKTDILSSYLNHGHINLSSFTSLLMNKDSSFVMKTDNNEAPYESLSKVISYALHLDNKEFVLYLKEKIKELKINHINDLIVKASLKKDGSEEIEEVIGENGDKYKFDVFVDCSGFKSLLMDKTLKLDYHSFKDTLFTDTAITAVIPNDKKVKPYTTAEAMDCGWCWNIPMREEDHRGYVFSSEYCTEEEAIEEMKRKNPRAEKFKTIKFKSGRYSHFCKGNTVAIGNSYAFVEPLESTGLHMIINEINLLVKNIPFMHQKSVKDLMNNKMNAQWDYLKFFLGLHFKFNKDYKTDFWKDCNEKIDLGDYQYLIDIYKQKGLLSYQNDEKLLKKNIHDNLFGLTGIDTILMGQYCLPDDMNYVINNKRIWDYNLKSWENLEAHSVPLYEDIQILTENPHLI